MFLDSKNGFPFIHMIDQIKKYLISITTAIDCYIILNLNIQDIFVNQIHF